MPTLTDVSGSIKTLSTGTQADIGFRLAAGLWEKVRAESGLCRGSKCKRYAKCHFQAARKKMQLADIVVVEGDPAKDLAALRSVRMVVKNGQIVREENTWN